MASFPGSLIPDENGLLTLPEVLERRLHIALHNTQTFLSAPTILTLQPVHSEYVGGDGFELVFNGNVELDRYIRKNPGVAIVFVLEYKVLMVTKADKAKKTGLGAILEKIGSATSGGDKKVTKVGLEKVVSLGWGIWTPCLNKGNIYITLVSQYIINQSFQEKILKSFL